MICMTSDRGLCGGFNNNLIKATERFIGEGKEGKEVVLIPVGRKEGLFSEESQHPEERVDVFGKFDMTLAVRFRDIIEPFIREEYDELHIIYNEFVNVSVQRPAVVRLFPFRRLAGG